MSHLQNDLIKTDNWIKVKWATTANPQVNSIQEIIHQVIVNLVCAYDLQNNYLDKDDPRSEILAAMDFVVQSTYHTTLQAMPGKLVFGHKIN